MLTLAEHVAEDGPLAVRDALGWTLRAALTLWELHAEGLSHGRVSADAIQFEIRDCSAKGKLIRPEELEDEPRYHSLARSRGAVTSSEDDVWALGIVLYFALTGELPYADGIAGAVRNGKVPAAPLLALKKAELDVMQPVVDRFIRLGHPGPTPRMDDMVIGLRDFSPTIAHLGGLEYDWPPKAPLRAQLLKGGGRFEDDEVAPLLSRMPLMGLLVVLALSAVGIGGFLAWQMMASGETIAQPVEVRRPRPNPPKTAKTARVTPSMVTPTTTESAPPPSPPLVGPDFVACTSPFFGEDAFGTKRIAVDFPCRERDPARGVEAMTAVIARGSGGRPTQVARAWSNLGWYRVAAFAVARANCCEQPPPIVTPKIWDVCKLDEALEKLAEASQQDDMETVRALKNFGVAATCVDTAGGGVVFDQPHKPSPQQAAVFLRMLTRLRASQKR